MSLVLDLLCDEFTKNDLLGEVLACNDDVRLSTASGKKCARYAKQNYQDFPNGTRTAPGNPFRGTMAIQQLSSSGAKPARHSATVTRPA